MRNPGMYVRGVAGRPTWQLAGSRPWYNWGYETDADPRRAMWCKLARSTSGAAPWEQATYEQLASIRAHAMGDAFPCRVWGLLNEPDRTQESGWAGDPEGAAWWTWMAIKEIRRVKPDAVIVAPNMYHAGDRVWLERYLAYLGQDKFASLPRIDVLGMHDYTGRYESAVYNNGWQVDGRMTYRVLGDTIDWVRAYSATHGGALRAGAPCWITETGHTWAQTADDAQQVMDALDTYVVGRGCRQGVTAAYWFVSYDSWWASAAPGTLLANAGGELTETGRRWLERVS